MTAETELYDALSGDAAVAALVGTRIYPEVRPEESALPAVAFVRIGTQPINTIHGTILGTITTLQVFAMAESFAVAEDLGTKVVAAARGEGFVQLERSGAYDDETETFVAVVNMNWNE